MSSHNEQQTKPDIKKLYKIENTVDELITIVDLNDNVINYEKRITMRKLNLCYRTVNVLIKNPINNKYTIQLRSNHKEYCPGHYDIVTRGVVSAYESVDDSMRREIFEEVGIGSNFLSDLIFLGKKLYDEEDAKCWEYFYYLEYSGEYNTNHEVEALEFWSEEEIRKNIHENCVKLTGFL